MKILWKSVIFACLIAGTALSYCQTEPVTQKEDPVKAEQVSEKTEHTGDQTTQHDTAVSEAGTQQQSEDIKTDDAHQTAASHETAGHHEEGGHHGGEKLGKTLPLWSIIPFVGILLSIALFPLLAPHFWHHHFGKISAMWAMFFGVPFLYFFGSTGIYEILHIYLIDYIPFIILLWALFTVSGGILIKGSFQGKPVVNTTMLLIGTLMASWIGTTGAAMVLIRPLLRANEKRKKKVHIVVFFIFLVANIGGSLTPLGDPPLFLGFLHSVPFFWTLHLLPHMAVASIMLLVIFFFVDTYYYGREKYEEVNLEGKREKLGIEGAHNFLFLGGVIAGVLLSGFWKAGDISIFGVHVAIQNLTRDGILICMGLLSLKTTKTTTRESNGFSWFPIQEVAYLFAGIFMTIIPALAILKAGSEGSLSFIVEAVKEPVHYFWVTGILSSFLDNAPTYLTFLNTALGQFYAGLPEPEAVANLISNQNLYLKGIAAGAVFMGANTYIGNAPNFMVKSIAEESGINMPSFFGYIFKYSLPFLIPVFIIITFIFFR